MRITFPLKDQVTLGSVSYDPKHNSLVFIHLAGGSQRVDLDDFGFTLHSGVNPDGPEYVLGELISSDSITLTPTQLAQVVLAAKEAL